MFSSSLASYPHRSENEQLVGYPHELLIPPRHGVEDIPEEDEDSDELSSGSLERSVLLSQLFNLTRCIFICNKFFEFPIF